MQEIVKSSTGPVTIRHVAQAAGVHVSTVSRALNPKTSALISNEVLKLVTQTAQQLGYRPNRAASALRTGRSHTIGVLVPDITNAVFPPILEGIEAYASTHGYFVLVANVGPGNAAPQLLERMHAQRIDGLIVATAMRDDPLLAEISARGIPAILVNRADESGSLAAVVSDDRLAMKMAVNHLIELGHTRIAHLAGPQDIPTGVARRQGFEQALRDHHLPDHGIVHCDGYSRSAGQSSTHALLAQGNKPSALVCCNDLVALGAYDALRELGLSVPQDISVTGHNDMPLVDMVHPPLTTIRIPHQELGRRATSLLLSLLEEQQPTPATVVLRPELIVRKSTQAPQIR